MYRYYLLVVFLLCFIVLTLHFFGQQSQKRTVTASQVARQVEVTPNPDAFRYQSYELFRSKDRFFHFSYPASWFIVDTTAETSLTQTDIFQTWSLSDFPETWNIKADFTFRTTVNNFQKLTGGLCASKNAPCRKESINSIVYNKTVEENSDGSQIISYEAWNGSRILSIVVTVKPDFKDNSIAEWQRIVSTFRFFQ